MSTAPQHVAADRLVAELAGIVGREHVLADAGQREFYSRDLSFRPSPIAAAVVQREEEAAGQGSEFGGAQ